MCLNALCEMPPLCRHVVIEMIFGVISVLNASFFFFFPQSLILIREDFYCEVDNILCVTLCTFKLKQQYISKMLETLIHA